VNRIRKNVSKIWRRAVCRNGIGQVGDEAQERNELAPDDRESAQCPACFRVVFSPKGTDPLEAHRPRCVVKLDPSHATDECRDCGSGIRPGMVIGSWVNAETASAYCLKSAAGYHTPKKQR